MSRAWFALAVAAVLGLFYVGAGLQSGSPSGIAQGQEVKVKPLFEQPAARKPSLQFHYVGRNNNSDIYRAKIPGGWLISATENTRQNGLSVAFVPDPDHNWDGNSLP